MLLLIVVSLFLACGLNPSVEFLERRGLARPWAVASVIVGALLGLALFLLAIVPVITDQVATLSDNVPGWLDDLRGNERIQELDQEYDVIQKIQDYVTDGDFLGTLFGGALGFGLKILSALFNAFIIMVLTLYFLASLETTKKAIYRLAPASRRDRVTKLGDRVIHNIGGYVSGAFVVAMCAGITSLIFLFFVGLSEYAVALAFVVAVLDVIPMIGATIGAVIVTAIAFATDVKIGIACAIFYLIYQQVENYVIYPRVMRRSVDVPGAVVGDRGARRRRAARRGRCAARDPDRRRRTAGACVKSWSNARTPASCGPPPGGYCPTTMWASTLSAGTASSSARNTRHWPSTSPHSAHAGSTCGIAWNVIACVARLRSRWPPRRAGRSASRRSPGSPPAPRGRSRRRPTRWPRRRLVLGVGSVPVGASGRLGRPARC